MRRCCFGNVRPKSLAQTLPGRSLWEAHGADFKFFSGFAWCMQLLQDLQCLWHTMCMWNLSEDLESEREFMRNSWLFGCFAGAKYKATGRQLPTIRAPFIGRALFSSILCSTMSFFLTTEPSWKSQLLIDEHVCISIWCFKRWCIHGSIYIYHISIPKLHPHLGSTVYLSKHLQSLPHTIHRNPQIFSLRSRWSYLFGCRDSLGDGLYNDYAVMSLYDGAQLFCATMLVLWAGGCAHGVWGYLVMG